MELKVICQYDPVCLHHLQHLGEHYKNIKNVENTFRHGFLLGHTTKKPKLTMSIIK